MLRRTFIAMAGTAFLVPQIGLAEEVLQTPEALISGLADKHGAAPVLLYLYKPDDDCGYCGIVKPAIVAAVQSDRLKDQNWRIEEVDVSQNPALLAALAQTRDVPACIPVINGKTYKPITGLIMSDEWETLLSRAFEISEMQKRIDDLSPN